MKRVNEVLCRLCNSLANPVCACGSLATAKLPKLKENSIIIYVNDLKTVELVTTWVDNDHNIVHMSQNKPLTTAKHVIMPFSADKLKDFA